MKYVLLVCAIAVLVYAAYEYVRISRLVRVGIALGQEARAYERQEGRVSILVLGDSTAVGVGAKNTDTVAGRLAEELDASVENYGVSGARTADVHAQFAKKRKDRYDLVLIQIGANDVIRFSDLERLRDDISAVLRDASEVSDHIVFLTAGKVGNAPFFPHALGWVWTMRAAQVREHFMAAAEKYDAAYVDLYAAPDPMSAEPEKYYAPDGLHLTAAGYGYWYEETKKTIEAAWPGVLYAK